MMDSSSEFYTTHCVDGYEWLLLESNKDFSARVQDDGRLDPRSWRPMAAAILTEDEGESFAWSDCPWFNHRFLALRSRAMDALSDVLEEAGGELLPLDVAGGEPMSLYNPRMLDVLDLERSEITRFSSGRIMVIDSYVLRESARPELPVFRCASRASSTIVDSRFVERFREAGLVGLEFRRIGSAV